MVLSLPSVITQVISIEDESQIGQARRAAQKLAEKLGFAETDAGRVALIATELGSNLLKHAGRGELHLQALPRPEGAGIELIAVDRGQGFDLHACLTDGYSTRGTQGIGLGAVERQSDVFDAYSDSRGSVLLARLYPRGSGARDCRFGASQHALHHDPACGDAWHLSIDGPRISALVIDGLGHGEEAEKAALAGARTFALTPFVNPTMLFDDLHQAMTGTRGGAVAVAQYDGGSGNLRFAGIGNIGATLIALDKSRGLASHPGIVGAQFRKIQTFDYPEATGQLLVMFSDGLQSRWSLSDYPGLINRHPAIIATVLHRDYCRGRDDVTVLAVALEQAHG